VFGYERFFRNGVEDYFNADPELAGRSLIADSSLRGFDQLHFALPRPMQHHQLALGIAEDENIFVAEVRLFDRFFQRHRTKRNRVPGMHQMHFGGPRHRWKFMNENGNGGINRQSERRLKVVF